jgi:uncharacterized protein (DUF736 family)
LSLNLLLSQDYPKYSSNMSQFSDLLNFDIKVPAEHMLEGVAFDAEIQMLHTHPEDERVTTLAVPVRATANGFNAEFQTILDQFQLAYEADLAACSAASHRRRTMARFFGDLLTGWGGTANTEEDEYSTKLDDPDFVRRLQDKLPKFNPYDPSYLTTLFFFRYDGSTTEPPCYPITWFVMRSPMLISHEQLRQIKVLIFTHVDGACQKTSVHNAQQSVARARFPIGSAQAVVKCQEGDFVSDAEKRAERATMQPTSM